MSDNGQQNALQGTTGALQAIPEPVSAILETESSKPGRPSKYSTETVDRLLAAMADGLNVKQSCLAAGIGESTLGRWRDEHPELESQLTQARETARRKVLAMIKSIGEETDDWRALDTWLQRSFPSDYRRDGNINVKASANAQAAAAAPVISAEWRKQMQERFKRLREGDAE